MTTTTPEVIKEKLTKGRKRKSPPPPIEVPPAVFTLANCRIVLTVTMGAGIPLLSLALSTISGTLARSGEGIHLTIALASLVLTGCVLWVSLGHLAWAIQDITRSPKKASWALAIAFDLCLVLGETVLVYSGSCGDSIGWLVTAMMASVAIISMVLNVWAFFRHPE